MSLPSEFESSFRSRLKVGESEAEGNPSQMSDFCVKASNADSLRFSFAIQANLWDPLTNPEGCVSLGLAENCLMHEELAEYLTKNFEIPIEHLTYATGGMGSGRLRTALAHFLNRRLNPVLPLHKDHIVVTNGCSSAIEHCSWMMTNPGDGVLLGQPYYGTFVSDIELRPGAKVVKVRFGDADPVGADITKFYEEALKTSEASGTKVKALVLCNPHNPLGRCYPREVIIKLMKLCQKHQIHLISDEIYAFSVFQNREDQLTDPVEFVSVLSIDSTGILDPHLVHVIWGMSKDFGANGIRIGSIITQSNPVLIRALQEVSLYSYPSGMADYTVAKLLEDDTFTDSYIKENSRKLSEQHSLVVRFLKDHGINYVPGVTAAFFLWADLGKAYADRHPQISLESVSATIMQKLLDKKVFLSSGEAFGSEQPGWFRIVFSQNDDCLKEGLSRMIAAISE